MLRPRLRARAVPLHPPPYPTRARSSLLLSDLPYDGMSMWSSSLVVFVLSHVNMPLQSLIVHRGLVWQAHAPRSRAMRKRDRARFGDPSDVDPFPQSPIVLSPDCELWVQTLGPFRRCLAFNFQSPPTGEIQSGRDKSTGFLRRVHYEVPNSVLRACTAQCVCEDRAVQGRCCPKEAMQIRSTGNVTFLLFQCITFLGTRSKSKSIWRPHLSRLSNPYSCRSRSRLVLATWGPLSNLLQRETVEVTLALIIDHGPNSQSRCNRSAAVGQLRSPSCIRQTGCEDRDQLVYRCEPTSRRRGR